MVAKLPKAWAPEDAKKWGIAKLAEKVFEARAARKSAEKVVKDLEAEESKLKELIINSFTVAEVQGVKTTLGSLSLSEKDVPKVVDKEAFGKWVYKNKAWDLLYGKAVEEGCIARWEDKKTIDGVEKFHKKVLTLTDK
jgi:hypothetical protein